jgi:thymidine kinase/deoxynucleoside kinase
MYDDPKRWGYLFQSYVLLTMMKQHHRSQEKTLGIMERSVYSARYCFVENLHINNIIDDAEYSSYCQWFNYLTAVQRPHLDLIVYLRTSPEVCLERTLKRARKEEKPVTLEYLQSLHDRHEEWLGDRENSSSIATVPVLTIDANRDCTKEKGLFEKFTKEMLNFSQISCAPPLATPPYPQAFAAPQFS